jgi:hypothetical protein
MFSPLLKELNRAGGMAQVAEWLPSKPEDPEFKLHIHPPPHQKRMKSYLQTLAYESRDYQ